MADSCPTGWTSLSTGCYQFVDAGSYVEAMTNCENKGGYLVEIDNQEEQNVLSQFHKESKLTKYVWLGGTDVNIEGQWIGSHSGRIIMEFNGWNRNEPGGGFNENCVFTHPNWRFKWSDYSCSWTGSATALCEYPDQVATSKNQTAGIWEKGMTDIYIRNNDKNYKCDVSFEFNVNNETLITQFRDSRSECTDAAPNDDVIEKLGTHSFELTSTLGITLKCSVGAAMVNGALSLPILEDSLDCSVSNDQCSEGWTSLATGCYKFIKVGSYEEANNNCRTEGGYLAEINNQDEQDALAKFHKESKLRTYVWLGGTDINKEGQWIGNYSGKEIMNFNGWNRNEPGGGFNENCVWIHYSWGFNKWGDYRCDYKGDVAALCEYADGNETETSPNLDPCSAGWTALDTGCYKFIPAGSYEEATNNCRDKGGYLVEINDQKEQDVLAKFHQKSKLRTYVWLGGSDVEKEGQWIGNYSGKEIMNFNGWVRNEPGGGFNENCVWLHYSWGFNKWGDYRCDYKGNVAALCEYANQNETQKILPTDNCSAGWTSLDTGCYKFVPAGSYEEATNNCKNIGGYLVEIDNEDEQGAITKFHQKSKLRTYVWIGGTDEEREGQWMGNYSGKEIMKFNGWVRNEPGGGFNENCVWLHYSWGFNKWGDYRCDYKGNVAALCEYADQNETQIISSTEPELNGYCLTSGGDDQNGGTQSLNAGGKDACYHQCKAVPQATGCEWHKDGGCTYHTLDVANGNGNSHYKCWVFNSAPTDSCSNGWTSLETGCYRFVKAGSYVEATDNCKNDGGYLVEIDNQEEQNEVAKFHQKSKLRTYVWLGGTDVEIEGQWIGRHSGREIMNFNGWVRNEPGGGFNENCVWLHYSWGFNKWGDYRCDYKGNVAALCEYLDHNDTQTTPIPALIWEKGMTNVYIGHNGKNYKCDVNFQFNVNNASLSVQFRDSKSTCSDSSPKADEIQSFGNHIFSMAAQSGIILKCSVGVVMVNGELSASILAESLNCFVTNDPCAVGWMSLSTGCYKIVKAGSYQEGIDNCEKEGGLLAEISNQEEQDELKQFFEKSKLRTYIWLGGTDVETEGQWLGSQSERIMNFTAWKSGEPNGGVKENCIITYYTYSLQWVDFSCSWKGNAAALCENSERVAIQT